MTEEVWMTGETEPAAMLNHIVRTATPRKLQLVSAATCGLINGLAAHPRLERGVATLALYADDFASDDEFTSSRDIVDRYHGSLSEGHDALLMSYAVSAAMESYPLLGVRWVTTHVVQIASDGAGVGRKRAAQALTRGAICGVLREIIGNPYRNYTVPGTWQGGGVIQPDGRTVLFTDAVKGLAEAVHVTGDFGRLPILADALEEAGVTDEVLLSHCRDGGPHLRGCWALDVVRGRA